MARLARRVTATCLADSDDVHALNAAPENQEYSSPLRKKLRPDAFEKVALQPCGSRICISASRRVRFSTTAQKGPIPFFANEWLRIY
jgi:hypothetical protein